MTGAGPTKTAGAASVAELIHRHLDRLTATERKPARMLLANYPVVGLEPLASFARRAGVSHPSILRFIAKLGFAGYGDFQTALRGELEARLESPLTKRHEDGTESPDSEDFVGRFVEATCDNIRQSVNALPRTEFDAVLSLLAGPRTSVYLLGGRFTDTIARHAYMHLRVLRPRVHHIDGPPVSWPEYLLDMDRHSVVLVFDMRRYQDDVVRFAREAAQRSARIVLFTDQWLSPIASVADHVLPVRVEVPSSWDSVAAMITLVEALIAALNNRQWSRLQGRIETLEDLRAQFERAQPGGEDSGTSGRNR